MSRREAEQAAHLEFLGVVLSPFLRCDTSFLEKLLVGAVHNTRIHEHLALDVRESADRVVQYTV